MDFSLSEEQTLLRNSVERFIADRYEFTRRMKLAESPQGWSDENWALFAEQGWLAIPFAEEDGGLNFGLPEMMIMMETMGRGLVLEPFFTTVALGGGFIRRAGDDLRARVIPDVIAGEHRLAFAHQERTMRHDPRGIRLTAAPDGGGWRLSGEKIVVVDAPFAHSLVVSARTGGAPGDQHGISLFLVPADAPGIEMRRYRTVDGRHAADIRFREVAVSPDALIGEADAGFGIIETVLAEANTALAAEAVGIMAALQDVTLEYLRTRKQFGRHLGSFQVIQHRMADVFMAVEQARSIMLLAVLTADRERREWLRNVSAAMGLIGRLSRHVGHEAIQFHGGIGMTEELNVGHYHKRLLMIQSLFGDVHWHNRRFRELSDAA